MPFTGQAGMGTVIASELVTFVGGPASGYGRARSLGRLSGRVSGGVLLPI